VRLNRTDRVEGPDGVGGKPGGYMTFKRALRGIDRKKGAQQRETLFFCKTTKRKKRSRPKTARKSKTHSQQGSWKRPTKPKGRLTEPKQKKGATSFF